MIASLLKLLFCCCRCRRASSGEGLKISRCIFHLPSTFFHTTINLPFQWALFSAVRIQLVLPYLNHGLFSSENLIGRYSNIPHTHLLVPAWKKPSKPSLPQSLGAPARHDAGIFCIMIEKKATVHFGKAISVTLILFINGLASSTMETAELGSGPTSAFGCSSLLDSLQNHHETDSRECK